MTFNSKYGQSRKFPVILPSLTGFRLFSFLARPTMSVPENRKLNTIPLHRTETREQYRREWWVISVECPYRKQRAFRKQHFPASANPRPPGHGSSPNLESVCSHKLTVLVARCECRRWSVSRDIDSDVGGWSSSVSTSCGTTGGHFRSGRNHPEMGQAPTPQATPRDTDHLRPSYLATRTLIIVEHTLSKFGDDPCPGRRGLATTVKWYVQKGTFFRFCWTQRDNPEPCVGFNTTKGLPVSFSGLWNNNR